MADADTSTTLNFGSTTAKIQTYINKGSRYVRIEFAGPAQHGTLVVTYAAWQKLTKTVEGLANWF